RRDMAHLAGSSATAAPLADRIAPSLLPPSVQRANPATEARVSDWIEEATSGWSPNLGQIADSDGRVATEVLYVASTPNAQVYVTSSGLTHLFVARGGDSDVPESAGGDEAEPSIYHWARLDVSLVGATIDAGRAMTRGRITGLGTQNYYLAHCPDGVLEVPTYAGITFPSVYPGVDWVVRSEPGGGVHHDFVVAPGADPSAIRLRYEGASSITVSDDGQSLIVKTALGEVREGALSCFQGDASRPVAARFELQGDEVTVRLGEYDRSLPLVIDPPLVWSTYYGGLYYDGPRSIYCDNANGTVYVVGYNGSFDLPAFNPGGGAYYQGTSGGDRDAFVWKFTQLGIRLWATYYGGSGDEGNSDCVVDAAGNLYVGGYTTSTNLPVLPLGGAFNDGSFNGLTDGFFVKFNSSGVRQWASYFGGASFDRLEGMTVDTSGRFYICGATSSSDFPTITPGGGAYFQPVLASATDAYVSRFTTAGVLDWSTYLGGAVDDDYANGILANASSVYVTGVTLSSTFPVFNPGGGAYFQGALGGVQDAFIARFSMGGVQQWITYFGGTGIDTGDEPALDAAGNAYLYGSTFSTDLPTLNPGGGAYYQPAFGGGSSDLFLARFDAANAQIWSTYIGGAGLDALNGPGGKPITVDTQGRVTITGVTDSPNYPLMNPGGSYFLGTYVGLQDAVITQFGVNGSLLWSTFWGDSNTDFGTSVSTNADGCVFATGESVEFGSMPTVNPGFGAWYQANNAGSDDGYIAKFCSPSSACCIDFTCVGVSSAAECNSIGGTAFFPGQPCSTTVCMVDCTICGTKFNDLNRDGVKQGGEPGLAGWTILLSYPNNTVYASTVTDAMGNYCFTGVPCGPWLVSEVSQPGWIQTAPPTFVHTLNTTTGTTTTGINFGNAACTTTPPCATPPTGLAAWWPFNDLPPAGIAMDVTHGDPAWNGAQLNLSVGAPGDPTALCLTSPGDYAIVPVAEQLDLDFGDGSFAMAAWLNMEPAGAGARMVADQRAEDFSSGAPGTRGWAIWLDGMQSYLSIGTGSTTQVVLGPILPANSWTHLVVSVDRTGHSGRWYMNGIPEPAFDFTPIDGNIDNSADLRFGQSNPAFGGGLAFHGCIGDISLFREPLDDATAYKAWLPGPIGVYCPEYALMPSMTTYCPTQTSKQVCFKIVNLTASAQSYHWALAPLPASPGCTVAGPSLISPSAGTVTVSAGGTSAAICVTVQRPAGMTAQNATACFQLTFMNDATGVCRTRTSKLRADNTCWCATPTQASVVGVPARVAAGASIGVGIGIPCDPVARAYQWRAVWLDDDHDDPLALSLNGLPPGEPVFGTLTAAVGGSEELTVQVSYPGGFDPTGLYEIVLEADTDGDGLMDRLVGTVVHPESGPGTASVPPPATSPVRGTALVLRVSPNPFLNRATIAFTLPAASEVTLGIYDITGRLVRRMTHGRLPAGPH
ncbi:MAG: LamG-like jellyroll fold domain-containing protein, partial [Candidatus Eisenbacteria bacterium]|nr:LamG-like jellyroll fold domain-containing protein [Candidatus Eisenbacteria bacterium]